MAPRSRWAALVASAAVEAADVRLARAQPAAPGCEEIEVEYALAANLELSDTAMGQGDGVYRIGPGSTVIRYQQRDGIPSGKATMVSYATIEHFTITAKVLVWSTRVTMSSRTTVATDGNAASGILTGRKLEWTSDIRGARTDGTLTCAGSLCGRLGVPAPGTSPLHVPPRRVRFRPWIFAPDRKTFTMARTWVGHSESPKQTSHVALSGREVRRTYVNVCG